MKTLTEREKMKIDGIKNSIEGLGSAIWDSKLGKVLIYGLGCLAVLGFAGAVFRVGAYTLQGFNAFSDQWNRK